MAFDRILLTGDAFRTVAGEPAQLANVQWLERILGPLLRDLTRLPMEISFPLAARTVTDFVALQGGQIGLDGWARQFWSAPSDALVSALKASCEGALVVGIEMPPVLEHALDLAGVAWIAVGVSPLRFLPDWALHLRASWRFDLGACADHALTADEVETAARHVSRRCAASGLEQPTLVFFAQTEHDRTLIRGGEFCGPAEALDGISSFRRGRRILVKPHPWQPESQTVQALVAGAGAELTGINTYALLADPRVEVVTLSSSVGREARAFGRRATILSPGVQDWAYSGIDVLRDARSAALWGRLLASAGVEVHPAQGPAWRPNELRASIGGQGLDLSVWSEGESFEALHLGGRHRQRRLSSVREPAPSIEASV